MAGRVTGKTCTKCGVEKEPGAFHNDKKRKDGKFPQCKACRKNDGYHIDHEKNRQWCEANSERLNQRRREQYASDPELRQRMLHQNREWHKDEGNWESRKAQKRLKYATDKDYREKAQQSAKEYRAANPEKVRESKARYYEANREKISVDFAERYAANREHLLEYQREYREANPEVKRASEARRRTRKKVDMDAIDRLLSAEYRKAVANDPCAYCGCRSNEMHDDHMTPLARGGTDHWWNLTRACADCNLSKHDKTVEEFLEYLRR